jgi:2,3-bisphosphoglycerate-independent phosphoglycerate mutase
LKYIILVGDGMGDLPVAELGFKTPLETAATPAMDHLCQNSELFRLQTIPSGMPAGSDIANLSLLGYEPQDFYTGRAPLEAASMGVDLAPAETAYRCNLVSLQNSGPESLSGRAGIRTVPLLPGHQLPAPHGLQQQPAGSRHCPAP